VAGSPQTCRTLVRGRERDLLFVITKSVNEKKKKKKKKKKEQRKKNPPKKTKQLHYLPQKSRFQKAALFVVGFKPLSSGL
jgi:alpha-tubulin suppressor-like RCC1 family protein